jgi:PEP-CTERM motif
MRLRRPVITAVLLLSVMVPSGAHAEPVQITSGFLRDVRPFGDGMFEFNGADFFAAGYAGEGIISPAISCWVCVPGNTINMRAWYPDLGSGTATVAGTSYDPIYFGGELIFESADVTAPAMTPNGFTVSQPFTLSGYVFGELSQASGPEVFRQALTGHGTVTASFSTIVPSFPGSYPLFAFETMQYEFASGAVPDPVPEPATLLLLGSGVGAALFRKGVRRRLE